MDHLPLSPTKASVTDNTHATTSAHNGGDVPVPELTMFKLREAYRQSQTKIDVMSQELAELKEGKVEMEAELENLSQALFEEANKMVADERRKRKEVEESLKEAKEEKEALRDTVKVLGETVDGPKGQDEGGGDGVKVEKEVEKDKEEDKDKSKAQGKEKPEEVVPDFEPRDLDKHYAALRKSIHHVADGTQPTAVSPNIAAATLPAIPDNARGGNLEQTTLSNMSNAPTASYTSNMSNMPNTNMTDQMVNIPATILESMSTSSIPPPVDPNPWANIPGRRLQMRVRD